MTLGLGLRGGLSLLGFGFLLYLGLRALFLPVFNRPLAAARAVIFGQMVDDPSAYVDVLRADPKLRRKAESALKARLKLWEEAQALAEKAKGSGLLVAEPGPAPALDDLRADLER